MFCSKITETIEKTATSTRHHTFTRHPAEVTITKDVYVTITLTKESLPTTISHEPNMMPVGIASRRHEYTLVTTSLVSIIAVLLYILLSLFWAAYKQSLPTFRHQSMEAIKCARHERDQALITAREVIIKHNGMVHKAVEEAVQLKRLQEVNAKQDAKLQHLRSAFNEMDGSEETHSLTNIDLERTDNFRDWFHTWKVLNKEKLFHELEAQFFANNIELDRQNRNLQAQIREFRRNYTNNGTIQSSIPDLEATIMVQSEDIRKRDEEIKSLRAGMKECEHHDDAWNWGRSSKQAMIL